MRADVVLTTLGTITILSLVIILILVTRTASTPGRVRLAVGCSFTAVMSLASWLIAAAVLP